MKCDGEKKDGFFFLSRFEKKKKKKCEKERKCFLNLRRLFSVRRVTRATRRQRKGASDVDVVFFEDSNASSTS